MLELTLLLADIYLLCVGNDKGGDEKNLEGKRRDKTLIMIVNWTLENICHLTL